MKLRFKANLGFILSLGLKRSARLLLALLRHADGI